jgi:hypothetical protein
VPQALENCRAWPRRESLAPGLGFLLRVHMRGREDCCVLMMQVVIREVGEERRRRVGRPARTSHKAVRTAHDRHALVVLRFLCVPYARDVYGEVIVLIFSSRC